MSQHGSAGRREAPRRQRVPEDVYGSWSPTGCPDGERLAFVSDRSGEAQVWLAELYTSQVRLLPADLRRVVKVSWSPRGDWLACVTAATGASRQHVWVVRPDGSGLHRVAGGGPVTAQLGAGRRQGWTVQGWLLVTEMHHLCSAFLIDPASGERRLVTAGPMLELLDVSDDSGRALVRYGPRSQHWLGVVVPDAGEKTVSGRQAVVGASGQGSTDRGALAPDGSVIFARSDAGRDRAALVAISLDGSQRTIPLPPEPPIELAARPDAELEDLVLAPKGEHLVLVWNVDSGCSELSVLDLATGRERPVGPIPRAVIDECCFSTNGSSLLLTAENWADPRGVWSVDLATVSAVPVTSAGGRTVTSSPGASVERADTTELSPPILSRLASTDGTRLTGWLYRPVSRPPWPTMIHLHGGPELQERPVYNSLFQSLVATGIAVFAPNVRGSAGFGRRFLNADNLAGRYGAIADVAACAEHLAASGVADPGRIGCMGRSYGGYLTLAALVWHPELFAVGVDVSGMSDFKSFFALTEPWIAAAATSKYGDPVGDEQLLSDLSPIHRIERLLAPLLIVHGGKDTNVPIHQAQQLVAALQARGVEHRYLLFPDEGHELLDTRNRVALVRATVAWVVDHLA